MFPPIETNAEAGTAFPFVICREKNVTRCANLQEFRDPHLPYMHRIHGHIYCKKWVSDVVKM